MDFLLQVITSLFADKDDLRLKGAPLAILIIYEDVSSGLGSLNTIRIIRRNQTDLQHMKSEQITPNNRFFWNLKGTQDD